MRRGGAKRRPVSKKESLNMEKRIAGNLSGYSSTFRPDGKDLKAVSPAISTLRCSTRRTMEPRFVAMTPLEVRIMRGGLQD